MYQDRDLMLILLAFASGLLLEHLTGLFGRLRLLVTGMSYEWKYSSKEFREEKGESGSLNADYNFTLSFDKAVDEKGRCNVREIYGTVVEGVSCAIREELPNITLRIPPGKVQAKIGVRVRLEDEAGRNILDLQR